MMKKLLLLLMMLAFALPPAIAGEKTVTISRNDISQMGVYYCDKGGVTMTFTSGMNNPNYLVEHQQVVFYIRSNNYVIKKIVFHCLDNTTENDLDAFYWGPSTISEEGEVGSYTPTGTYTYTPGGYIGTWVAGSVDSKNVAFTTKGRPVRFGSVEITYEKEFGDIFELVKSSDEIAAGNTYALVSKYSSRALGKVENHQGDDYESFSSTPVTLLDHYQQGNIDVYNKVKVTDEVSLIKLERAVSTTTSRPWHLKVGDNYIRRRNGEFTSGSGTNAGYNLWAVPNLPTDEFNLYFFRVSISIGTNYNALLKFYHTNSEVYNSTDMAIRHDNGGSLFRVMNSNSSSNSDATLQRVYLYKPAQSYEVTTECIPSNGGYITLGGGVLTDDHGKNWSQHFDNVTFFVGPTGGYGISNVTITDLNTRETTILDPVNTSDFGNDYSFEMPANDVKITANFLQPYDIHTVINPNGDSGSFEFIDGYTDFNGQPKSNEGKTVTFKPVAADGYSFTSVTGIDDVTGQPLNITLDADGNYSFEMPGNSVTLTANFDLIPYFVITTECQPSDAGRIDVYDGVATVDNAMTAAPGNVVTFWVEHYNDNVIQSVTVTREGVTEPVALNELDGNQFGRRYSFTMPTGNVHIVATFEPYNGLYLLGTSMGRTNWCPSGPKFTFDATNNEYYLDVYFKGGNDNADVDQAYGYFSFAQTVTNFDWTNRNDNSSDWSGVSGRLAATSNNYPVDGNSSEVYLSGNANETSNFNNAFKIPAGVYRIIVNRAKNQMRIVETPLHLTFDPESGSIVPQGKVVTIDSDLEDVVHAIASSYEMTEDSQKFRNTTDDIDNNPTWVSDDNVGENGAQATINQDGTTVHAEAWIGYIVVPGSATYNFADYDITSICYPDNAGSITVAGTAQEGATVTFTVGTNEGYTLSSVVVVKSNDPTGEPIVPTDNGDGTYTFTMPAADVVIMANFSEAIQYYTATTHWNPQVGGSIWLNGSNAFNQVVSFAEGSTVEFTVETNPDYRLVEVVVTNTTTYEELCYPEPDANNVYTFEMPAQNVYIMALFEPLFDITKQVTPDGAGVITAPESSLYNETVNFSVVPNPGYILNSVTVTKDGNHQTVTVTDNGGGNYSFTMPEADVTVAADFTRVYDINTVCNPPEGGSIVVVGDADSSVSGSEIEFNVNVNSNDGYALSSVVVTDATGETIDCNYNNGTYSFTMPESDVTITATFGVGYHVVTLVDPEYSAQCNVYWSAYPDRNIFAENTPMTVEVTPELGYVVDRITLTNNTTEQVTELSLDPNNPNMTNFVMPNSDVTVTVYLNTTSLIFRLVTQVEQIIEGKTYTFVSQQYDKVLNRIIPNATSNRYSSTDIVEWAAPNKSLVRLDPNAAFFKAEDVGELVHNYGDNTIRSAYFKTIGGYLGFEDLTAPDDDVVNGCLTLCASKDDVKPIFTRIISNSATRSRNRAESVLDYGDGVDPAETDYNVTNQSRVIDINPNGEFIMSNRVPYYVWLYKLAEPYNISTEVYDAAAAAAGCNLTIEQTFGVLGTTALDGVNVTITPEPVGDYVLSMIKYYTPGGNINGTTLNNNVGGSYSFTMPASDVTIKATFEKGYNITTECYPPEGGVITVQPKAAEGQTVFFSVTPNPGYAFDNELGGWPLKFYIRNENDEFEEFEPNNLQYFNINNGTMRFEMPDADVKIVAFFETGYTVTTVVNPPEGGHFRTSSDESIGFVNTFAEGSNVYVDLWPNKNPNYDVKSVVLTYTIDGVQHEEELEGEPGDPGYPMNLEGWMLYYFEMPAAHVTVTAELELSSPLSFVECPIGDNKYAPLCDDHVIVTDNLIGVWAVKNLLWTKDQSPQVSNDEVKRPDGTIDYLRQNFKLQKKPWDQSNWVILDFSKTEGWTGSESDYIEVEKYVDHQIKGGSIHGIYSCDGDDYKGKNKIILDEKPVVIIPEDHNSLGYPGYLADPRELDPNYDYMYNHYIPANFIQDNIGGRFGGAGENGVIPGNEDYKDLRMFFMNPKDQEVAQVWAVWYGTMEFPWYDNWHNKVMMNGDVFKIYESSIVGDGENEVSYNLYDFKGAFYVPSWKYNRLSSDRNDYGKPDGSGGHDALKKHNEYLFHVAIMTKGTEYMIVSKAPKRADGPLAQEDSKPWDHYEVYPLDLEPSSSVVTAVREIAAPASTEIVSIRYYNIMGQESMTPFDGINIEVIRYKDGSMISNKVLK